MASQFPPKKNTEFTLYFTLYKNDGTIIANPGTITKKISIDGASVADISASITEEDTTYGQCSVVLSASEMNGDAIWIYIADNTTGCVPFTCTIYTTSTLFDTLASNVTTIDTVVDSLTTTIGTAGSSLTALPWNSAWDAEVQSECADALIAYDPPTNAELEARTLIASAYFDPSTDTVTLANGSHGGSSTTLTFKSLTGSNSDASGSVISLTASGTGNSHGILINSTNGKALALGSVNSNCVTLDAPSGIGLSIVGGTADISSDITGTISTMLTASAVRTELESSGADLDTLIKALVNKRIYTNADGTLELFSDASASLGTIASQISTDGTYTIAKRAAI